MPMPSSTSVSCTTRALAISEKALGLEHPDVAVSLNNLASVYQHQGRFAEAEHFTNGP